MIRRRAWVAAAVITSGALALAAQTTTPGSPGRVDTLRSVRGLPVEIVGEFRDSLGFERVASGLELVFDRRGHAVYGIAPERGTSRKL